VSDDGNEILVREEQPRKPWIVVTEGGIVIDERDAQ